MISIAAGYDGIIRIITKLENGEFNKGVKGITSSLKNIAAAVGLAFSTQKLIEFGKESLGLASDLQEVQNVVDTVFKDSANEINEFSKTALEAYGLSELSAKKYASTMGAMLDSMQVSDKEMLVMSENLTALSGDMASFYNLSGDEAFNKIRAGISGETEPLKQLGINMSVANLEAYALSQGITKSYKAMSQSEQAILRYNYLLSVTANAQGDFARTQDGWANQTRILSERFNQLKIIVGNLLINVLTPALRVLNELLSTALAFAQTLSSSLGLEQNNTSSTVSSVASSQEDLASATEEATEAQEEQNKALASFDKLNDISKGSGSAAASESGNALDMELNSYAPASTSDFDTTFISEKLEEILALVGTACLAIGVILAFTGNIPLGIGLIAVGAASLAAAAKINNSKLTKDVTSQLDMLVTYISGVVLLLGVLLAVVCPTKLALGIGLIIAGVVGMATVVATNWDSMPNKFKTAISLMMAVASASLVVIGILLCVAGNYPLGIGLIIAGVAGLATVVAFNWDSIVTKVKTTCTKIKTVANDFGNDVKTWFTELINKGIGTFEGFINKIIGGLNWLIAKLNAFKITIPKWIGGDYGGKSLGFNITPFKNVSIPRLATGAVIPARSEFLAVLGDQKNGRNLEAPEGLIRQIVREESSGLTFEDIKSAFYMALLMAKQNGILDFDVNMDGKKVGQHIAKPVGDELNRSGFVFRTAKG